MVCPQVVYGRDGLQIWRIAANILNKQSQTADKGSRGGPPAWGLDSIKIDLIEIGWVGMDWIDLTEDRGQWRALVNMVMNPKVP
jgi:hypothetical protein